jgi:hypothetical protein
MPKPTKKTLPRDFRDQLEAGDLDALKAVFESCLLEARGGSSKQTTLAFNDAPEDLIRWLVEQGADLEARDTYQRTPLHAHAGSWNGKVAVLLELGADPHAVDYQGDTPLHVAAKTGRAEAVRALLAAGAKAGALNTAQMTPLAAGLQQCSNIQIEAMADIADQLLGAAPSAPPKPAGLGGLLKRVFPARGTAVADRAKLQGYVTRIGENFEFHRAGFNPEFLDATSDALDRLYVLFDTPPVPRRAMHDGKSPIVATGRRWQDRQSELWALLVPSSGAAATVQGEVIRIAGRIGDEIDRNGGVNWDDDYRAMGAAFLTHIASGAPLPDADQARAAELIRRARTLDGVGEGLTELSVEWVRLNPTPVPLATPAYNR